MTDCQNCSPSERKISKRTLTAEKLETCNTDETLNCLNKKLWCVGLSSQKAIVSDCFQELVRLLILHNLQVALQIVFTKTIWKFLHYFEKKLVARFTEPHYSILGRREVISLGGPEMCSSKTLIQTKFFWWCADWHSPWKFATPPECFSWAWIFWCQLSVSWSQWLKVDLRPGT